jgi:hypothetical protein
MSRPRYPLALAVLLPALAQAAVDDEELGAGPTYLRSVSGWGGLTAGVGPGGELAVLAWPSPAGTNQVRHHTAAVPGARALPRMGAAEDDGVHLALAWNGAVTWLRDAPFLTTTRRDGAVIVVTHDAPAVGLRVTEESFVDPGADVLFRHVSVSRSADSSVTGGELLVFENLDASALGSYRDTLAAWDPDAQALLHADPRSPVAAADLDPWLRADWDLADWGTEGWPSLESALASPAWEGTVALVAASVPADAWTVGQSAGPDCASGTGWTWSPRRAWEEAQDGTLSSSPVAACDADGAFSLSLGFGAPGFAQDVDADFYLVLAPNHWEATLRLAAARQEGWEGARTRVQAAAGAATSLDLTTVSDKPGPDHDAVVAFYGEALQTLRQARVQGDGSLISGLARQPFRSEERAADALWQGLALTLSGDAAFVDRHDAAARARAPVGDVVDPADPTVLLTPAGSFAEADGSGGPPSPGATGDVLWSLVAHAAASPNEASRRARLAASFPTIRRAADWLAACVPDGHPALVGEAPYPSELWTVLLQRLRSGDAPTADEGALGQANPTWANYGICARGDGSLHEALRVRAGLLAAARAARILCAEDAGTGFWSVRAAELGSYIWAEHHGPTGWSGPTDRLLWPEPPTRAPSHDPFWSTESDPALARTAVESQEREGFTATAQADLQTLGAAVRGLEDGDATALGRLVGLVRWAEVEGGLSVAEVDAVLRLLATRIAAGAGGVLGEVWVSDGAGGAEPRVGQPHAGSAARAWLAALARTDAATFSSWEGSEPVCSAGAEPELRRGEIACDGSCAMPGPTPASVLPLLLGLLLRRRRQPRTLRNASRWDGSKPRA